MPRLKPRTIRVLGTIHAWFWKVAGLFDRPPFMLLTTKGRKTGRPRTTPVLYLQDGADLIVVASFGGNNMHPAWYLNLESTPEGEIMIKGDLRRVRAYKVTPEEKRLIWPRLIKMYPDFAAYQQRTSREIPLLRLSDAGPRG
jgi:deazaflavin-dependent oxidoreductase (nitroreductase family)